MDQHLRARRFEVSNWRPERLADRSWLQGGRISLPQCFGFARFGDVDGDGHDELFSLDRGGETMEVRDWDGRLVDQFPIQRRVYISDMLALPVLPGAKGAQFIYQEWNDDFTRTECVIVENLRAVGPGRPFDQLEMATKTVY